MDLDRPDGDVLIVSAIPWPQDSDGGNPEDEHPARKIDVEAAARTMVASVTGRSDYWDAAAIRCNPILRDCGTDHSEEILDMIREDMPEVVESEYQGDDFAHPDALPLFSKWAETRAREKRDELSQVKIDDLGRIAVHRLISCPDDGLRCGIGIFWAEQDQDVETFMAPWHVDGLPTMLVRALVHHSDVDWQTTCLARMDWYSGDYEAEIRLNPGRPLCEVVAIRWLDADLNSLPRDVIPLPDTDWTT